MGDTRPLTESDEQEMLDWVRDNYRDKVAETIQLFLRIKFPGLKDIEVTCKGAGWEINYKGDFYSKEDIIKSVDEFITDARK